MDIDNNGRLLKEIVEVREQLERIEKVTKELFEIIKPKDNNNETS